VRADPYLDGSMRRLRGRFNGPAGRGSSACVVPSPPDRNRSGLTR
jgi:hypothetical protein